MLLETNHDECAIALWTDTANLEIVMNYICEICNITYLHDFPNSINGKLFSVRGIVRNFIDVSKANSVNYITSYLPLLVNVVRQLSVTLFYCTSWKKTVSDFDKKCERVIALYAASRGVLFFGSIASENETSFLLRYGLRLGCGLYNENHSAYTPIMT